MSTYYVTGYDVIRDALLKIEALEEGEDMSAEHTVTGLRALNLMIQSWAVKGLNVWRKEEGVVFLTPGKRRYTLPVDNMCQGDFNYTLLNGAQSAGTAALPVDSTLGFSVGDVIGIELPSKTRQWTTISSVDSSTQVTIGAGLIESVADNATVFAYTTEAGMPKRILGARRGQYSGAEVPLDIVARDIYTDQPNKDASGVPVLAHYSPGISSGDLYVWPTANSVNDVLWVTYEREFAKVGTVDETPDFPIEWAETLIYNLAVRLAPDYRVPTNTRLLLKEEAKELLDELLSFDNETGSLFMQPHAR